MFCVSMIREVFRFVYLLRWCYFEVGKNILEKFLLNVWVFISVFIKIKKLSVGKYLKSIIISCKSCCFAREYRLIMLFTGAWKNTLVFILAHTCTIKKREKHGKIFFKWLVFDGAFNYILSQKGGYVFKFLVKLIVFLCCYCRKKLTLIKIHSF